MGKSTPLIDFSSIATGPSTGQRPGFNPRVEQYFYRGVGARHLTLGELIFEQTGGQNNLSTMYHQCASCQLFYPQEALNIDHKIGWAQLNTVNTLNFRNEEIDEYNNLQNLQLLCTSCNQARKGFGWVYNPMVDFRSGLAGPGITKREMQEAQSMAVTQSLGGTTKPITHKFFT